MRLLLVEDSVSLGEAVREQITDAGYAVDWMQCLAHAQTSVATTDYDLILLDLLLPDGKGLDFLKKLRQAGNTTPIIILTALDQLTDRIAGLNAGADDYLVKPFDLDELSARIAAVARRSSGNPSPVIQLKDLKVDLVSHKVARGKMLINLTAKEWAVFEALLQHSGALLSRAQLEDNLYAFGAEIESNAVEVHISRLRKKLGHDLIETVRGMGYRLVKQ
ncbi:MAG TPA: response regulator transcription factor [Marinospirillum sp.]|uniref:response regulator transcription factor n=1 Tax=Marinospirillum sp. TaxID=2183934 RepID=UPI002B4767DA|nr:response regulator transcription factor [Marinospirillum sp.]HKM15922.1 response regulator transcription factor [Marinospirillum sp.]